MIRGYVAILSLLYCTTLGAGIYRWVDADGRVHFSDRPEQGAAALVPAAVPAQRQTPPAIAPPPAAEDDGSVLGTYTAVEILAPAPDETLTQETNSLSVSLLLDPPLAVDQQLGVLLDGTLIPVANSATQFRLTGLAVGSHRLQAQIQDADGELVARTSIQTFHLRKPQKTEQPGLLR